MNPRTKDAHLYQQIQINTANPLQLVLMLYEGALSHIAGAVRAIEVGKIESRSNHINQACSMIAELQGSLDMERGGEIARSLSRLYTYITGRLCEANTKNDTQPLEESQHLLSTLWSAWHEVAGRSPAVDNESPATRTVNG